MNDDRKERLDDIEKAFEYDPHIFRFDVGYEEDPNAIAYYQVDASCLSFMEKIILHLKNFDIFLKYALLRLHHRNMTNNLLAGIFLQATSIMWIFTPIFPISFLIFVLQMVFGGYMIYNFDVGHMTWEGVME